MAQKDFLDAKEYVKELRETYWEGYSAGYDAAIENLRHSIGTACVSASTLKQITMEREKKKRRRDKMNRNYVYAFPSVHGTCNVVNYSGDCTVNTFLWQFDIWGSNGHTKFHNNDSHSWIDFLFECSKEFFEMLHTETMKRAFKHMGVELVFEYPFMEEFENGMCK